MYNKDEILTAILDIFLKYGIKSVAINDICTITGTPKQVIYNLFNNKDEIVEQVLLMHINDIKQLIYKYESLTSKIDCLSLLVNLYSESIYLFSRAEPVFYHNLSKYYNTLFTLLYEFRDQYYLPFVKGTILQGIDEGLFMKDTDPDLVLYSQMHLLSLLFNINLQLDTIDKITPDKLLHLIINEIRGITTLKGHKSLDLIVKKMQAKSV